MVVVGVAADVVETLVAGVVDAVVLVAVVVVRALVEI